MSKKISFSVVPDSLIFRDSKVGETDTIDVWVTNIGKRPAQIRYILPTNSKFIITANPALFTPPGLESKAVLKYNCTSNEIIRETLIIESQDSRLEMPILALPPSPRIIPDNDTIDMGSTGVDTHSKITFSISNLGTKEGQFQIKCDDKTIEFIPQTGKLLPNKSCEIAATITPNKVGNFNYNVSISAEGQVEEPSILQIQGKAIQHSLQLTIDDKEVKTIDFQTIFLGQKRIIDAKIVNTGPYKRSFVIMPPKETPRTGSRAEQTAQYMQNNEDLIFSAYPPEGTLNPYQSTVVRFVFNPPPEQTDITEESEKEYKHYSSIEIVETSQNISFSLIGRCVKHSASLSATDFNFDTITVMNRDAKFLTLKNNSRLLPTSFVIKPVAHFRFEPAKGNIQPGQTKTVQIVFYPKTLGDFNTTTTIVFSDGLYKKTLYLTGKATQTGKELKQFQRIDPWEATPETKFNAMHPNSKYAYDLKELEHRKELRKQFDRYLSDPREKKEARKEIDEKNRKMREKAKHHLEQTLGTYTDEEFQEYLQQEIEKEALDYGFDDDDLGVPDPPLRKGNAPLVIPNAEKFGLITRNENYSKDNSRYATQQQDDKVLIKKKFKQKATTPSEITECSHPLTPAQQLLVAASHETMNLGQVSVFSTVARSFAVTNNLQQNIIVEINYEYEELSQSGPSSQVIPPKQTAGFDIKFSSSKPQNFMKTIQYTVNGVHSYSVNIAAQVIPIEIQLSKNIVDFRFAGDSTHPVIKEFVTIINKSSADAKYSWVGIDKPFSIGIMEGVIQANSQESVEITYKPTTKPHDEQTITLNVAGGPSRALKLVGDIGSPKCSLNKKALQFGLMPLGIVKTQQIRLKNSGDDDAIFTISVHGSHELTVSPMSGRVGARESQTLQISVKPMQARMFDIQATINICGAPPINFNVTGQSELPKVQMMNAEFDFGRVYVGSYQSLEGTIKNIGAIPAILYLDLSNHPEFRIESQTDISTDDSDKVNSISLVSDPFFITKMIPANEYLVRDPSSSNMSTTSSAIPSARTDATSISAQSSMIESSESSAEKGLIYKIQIMDNSQITFKLIFQPAQAGDHSFELPITMMNMIVSSSMRLQPIVCAEAVDAPVMTSTSSLDFGISPIFDPLNPNMRKVVRTISIFNKSSHSVPWRFAVDENNPIEQAFTFEPSSGVLEVGTSTTLHVLFAPNKNIPHNCYIPLYAKGKDESIVAKVQLTGVGTNSVFSISHPDVCLPAVPLNTKSQLEVFVRNDAFIDGLLKTTISADENAFPVKITFPEGNQLQHTQEKLPLLITFQSSKPMSFSVNVALTDENGHACNFSVTCTADNSIFTLYSYINNPNKLHSKSTVEDYQKFLESSELMSRFISSPDYTDLKGTMWSPSFTPLTIKFVQRYFNTLFFSTQLSDFPEGLVSNQGAVITEMINNFQTGKKAPQNDERVTTAVDDKLPKRLENIKKLINTLKGMGALLASVKPEFLLPRNDFIQLMRTKIMKHLMGLDSFGSTPLESMDKDLLAEFTSSKAFSSSLVERLKILESLYNNLSTEAWMTVLLQTYKIFGLSRIQSEKLNSVPGVQQIQKQIKALKSSDDILGLIPKKLKETGLNVHETAILKWLSFFAAYMANDSKGIQADFHSLSDGYAFCAVMNYHTTMFKGTPVFMPTDKHQKEQNAIEFCNAMKYLKLTFSPLAEEVVNGNDCVNAMIGAYLLEIIPHFIPISTIEFSGPLHKPVTRAVSLSNPSKSEIMYRALFEGSPNYSFPSDTVLVGPNQTVDFQIQFQARTIKPLAGRLTLIPGKPRHVNQGTDENTQAPGRPPTYSVPVVVDLVSNISVCAPETSINIDTPIYQEKHLQIPVKNLLNCPSNMKVYKQITKIADENNKEIGSSKTLLQQISSFVANPQDSDEDEFSSSSKPANFNEYIKLHKAFILTQNEISFTESKNETYIDLDFVPIELGTYRCLILFIDEHKGEFVYEVIAKSTLPQAVEMPTKFKTEASKKVTASIPVDFINPNLNRALAFSIERIIAIRQLMFDKKLKDDVTRRQHEIDTVFKQTFGPIKFKVIASAPQFFELSNELTLMKSGDKTDRQTRGQNVQTQQSQQQQQQNNISICFKPPKAGDYPCKIVLLSENDVRVFQIKGVGLQTTRELEMEMQTVTGKSVKQEIPLQNPSDEIWQYKVTIQGDPGFSAQPRCSIKPGQTLPLSVQFTPAKIGTFTADMTIFNITKESTVIYKLTATVEEPPAEDKIIINAQARIDLDYKIDVKRFTQNPVSVTTTIPVLVFNPNFQFQQSNGTEEFAFKVSAARSGIAVGTLTFTDTVTKTYIWYIIELHISVPSPEQTLEVSTVARQSVTVSIPIKNPKDREAAFQVTYQDPDIKGDKEFFVPAKSSYHYDVVISPIKACSKVAAIYFFSEGDGEFWYNIKITATDPPPNTLAPMSAPLGKSASSFILLENPSDKNVNFRVDNENSAIFQVLCKRLVSLMPLEKKRIEVRYIPSSVGQKEATTISFRSAEVGDSIYKVTGTGKPPQPLSPTIISSVINCTNSALILFENPFPFPAKFSVTMTNDNTDVFQFLVKKKVFTLNSFGEEFQMPFTFSPKKLGQFTASIVIVSLGPARGPLPALDTVPSVRWVYPIIGNAVAYDVNEVKLIKTRANETAEQKLEFSLVGENEHFEPSEYSINVELPQNLEFLRTQLVLTASEVQKSEAGVTLVIVAKFMPMRPAQGISFITIKNKIGQEWQFRVEIIADIGKPVDTIVIESLLNKMGTTQIQCPSELHTQKPFHAYFATGSASEFSVSPEHGIAIPGAPLPVEIQFCPKTYGKILKGVFVVDMMDAQFIYDIVGKMPDYVPPVVATSSLAQVVERHEPLVKKPKRNIIRDNINATKLKKPR